MTKQKPAAEVRGRAPSDLLYFEPGNSFISVRNFGLRTGSGRLLHAVGPAMAKALRPMGATRTTNIRQRFASGIVVVMTMAGVTCRCAQTNTVDMGSADWTAAAASARAVFGSSCN